MHYGWYYIFENCYIRYLEQWPNIKTIYKKRYSYLVEKLIMPCVECIEWPVRVDIIDKHTTICPSVERNTKTLEPLLPCRVPDLGSKQHMMTTTITTPSCFSLKKAHQLCETVALTCKVTSLSSMRTSFVTKSAPIVALYCWLNFLWTYLAKVKNIKAPKIQKPSNILDTLYVKILNSTSILQ